MLLEHFKLLHFFLFLFKKSRNLSKQTQRTWKRQNSLCSLPKLNGSPTKGQGEDGGRRHVYMYNLSMQKQKSSYVSANKSSSLPAFQKFPGRSAGHHLPTQSECFTSVSAGSCYGKFLAVSPL